MTSPLTIYSTDWCGSCHRLKRQLAEAGIDAVEINIELDESAADWVMDVNTGDRTVPTVRFADDSALTNPSVAAVQAKLTSLGELTVES